METVTIPKEEYLELKKYKIIVTVVEAAIHQDSDFHDLLVLSESCAENLWNNEYDSVWDEI